MFARDDVFLLAIKHSVKTVVGKDPKPERSEIGITVLRLVDKNRLQNPQELLQSVNEDPF